MHTQLRKSNTQALGAINCHESTQKSYQTWRNCFSCKSDTIRSLKIRSKNIGESNDEMVQDMINYIARLKDRNYLNKLAFLSLDLTGWDYCSSNFSTTPFLRELILNLKSIRTLHLDFWGCSDLNDTLIGELTFQLKTNLRTLQNFHIALNISNQISNEAAQKLMIRLGKNLKYLSSLHVTIKYLESMTDQPILLFANHIGKHIKSLQKLEFYLDDCPQVSFESISLLALKISQNLENMIGLHFHFENCGSISAEMFTQMITSIGTMTTLTELVLQLTNYGGDDIRPLENICNQLINLQSLQTLNLEFYGDNFQIYDESIETLMVHVGAQLTSLNHLYLYFTGNQELSDSSVYAIANKIGTNILNLQSLHLYFNSCGKITQASVKTLVIQIRSHFKTLSCLHLAFYSNFDITEELFEELNQVCSNLSKLNDLHLDFYKTSNLVDEPVQKLASIIEEHLNRIDKLTLSFHM